MFRPPSLLAPQIVPTAASTAAGQPGLLRPGTSCFVTSARSGYANRPNTGNWRYGDLHPARLSALSAASRDQNLPIFLERLMQRRLHLAVEFVQRGNPDPERHCAVGLRGLEATNCLACVQPQMQNDRALRCQFDSGEASPPCGELYQITTRKNDHLASCRRGVAAIAQRTNALAASMMASRISLRCGLFAYCPRMISLLVALGAGGGVRTDGRSSCSRLISVRSRANVRQVNATYYTPR
jgi:hypothetical protein